MNRLTMNRHRSDSPRFAAAPSHPRRRGWTLRGRELDLLLLAGCSCLITTLAHPVAEALQARSVNVTPVAVQTGQAQSSQPMTVGAALPTRREEIHEEEA